MNWLRGFMQGRRGPDPLTLALLVVYWPFSFLGRLPGFRFCSVLALVLLAVAVYRIFSKDLIRRERENRLFLNYWRRLRAWLGSLSPGNIRQKITAFFPGRRTGKGQGAAPKTAAAFGDSSGREKDTGHEYFSCPFCGQSLRIPRISGEILVTCPKCGRKFDKKF